jgi:AcrR family transcriptional regulator
MASERLRDVKREETRRRLIEAGDRMIGERGYDETTAADIALAAGVTERTFFRHFESKGEVVIANWRKRAADLTAAMHDTPLTEHPIDAVRAGLLAFTEGLVPDAEVFRSNVRTIGTSRPLGLLMLDVLVDLEQDVARELAQRLGRSADEIDVRIAAIASIGVLRAVMRSAAGADRHAALADGIDAGLRRVAPIIPPPAPPRSSRLSGSKQRRRTRPARTAE